MALTPAQLTDMYGDLAIGDDESVFTDVQLEQFFQRAGEDYNLAVYYGWRQILASSAKWVDYAVAQTKVSRSQAFDHIKAMVGFWADESRTNANQLAIVGMNPVPTVHKARPMDDTCYPKWPARWTRWRY